MARIRSIKPEFWTDYRLARDLTRDQRLFYIALWNEADDEGRFLAHPRRLLGVCFPYDDDLSESFIEDSLNALAQTGRLVLYEVDGEPYGQLTKFREHQRPNRPQPSKLPAPPADTPFTEDSLNEHGARTEPSTLEMEEEMEEEGEEEGEKEREREIQQPTSSRAREVIPLRVVEGGAAEPDAGAAPPEGDREELVSRIIRAANAGMAANPAIDQQRLRPIPTGHGSRQDVLDWLEVGIPPDVILETVTERAREYRPDGTNRQISTMRYFTAAVLEAWERRQATTGGTPDEQHHRRGPAANGRGAAKGARAVALGAGDPSRRSGWVYE